MPSEKPTPDTGATSTANGEALAIPMTPNSPQALQALFGDTQSAVFCTWDTTTPEGIRLLDKCAEERDAGGKESINTRFKLQHFYGSQVPMLNAKTGEVELKTRTCLVTDEGRVIACVSDGIKESIARLVKQHQRIPFTPPIPVVLKVRKTNNGNDWLYLVNDTEATSTGKGGKK